jgi:tripartite-type tricarboxylate transporter receptor subunit TctC
MTISNLLRSIVAFCCALPVLQPVMAQGYPDKPIRIIVPTTPGGPTDVLARLLGERLRTSLGQTAVIDNRGGAGGAIGARAVAQAPADGYTLVFNSTSISTVFYSGLIPFDYRAFDAIARVTVENPVIAVRANAPWKDLQSMVEDVKKRPGAVSIGNSGIGSHTHISSVAFFKEINADVMHVEFTCKVGLARYITGIELLVHPLMGFQAALEPHSATAHIVEIPVPHAHPIMPKRPL